jgi:hypothetical protein
MAVVQVGISSMLLLEANGGDQVDVLGSIAGKKRYIEKGRESRWEVVGSRNKK